MAGVASAPDTLKTAVRRDIPSLDGLRAVSIAIVILSHTKSLLPAAIVNSGLFRYLIGGGLHGVQIFFVISGYLITTLLLREFERSGDISLKRFYARRTLRIFPPFYAYMAVLAVLWIAGVAPEDPSTFATAATYAIIYHPNPIGWFVQHTWSLSIEEQFYLLWPVALLFAQQRRQALRIAVTILAVMPIARLLLLFAAPNQPADHNRLLVNSSAIDMLLVGCLLALLAGNTQWQRWRERYLNAWTVAAMLAVGLVLVPYANAKLAGPSGLAIVALGYSLTALAIGAALEYVVTRPQSMAGAVLNLGLMRHLGLISYSVYLWQQLFTKNPERFGILTYVLILLAAESSFWLIEKPVMRLRRRLAL